VPANAIVSFSVTAMLGATVTNAQAYSIWPCYQINGGGWNVIGANMQFGATTANIRSTVSVHGQYANGATALTNFQVGFCWRPYSTSSGILDNNDWLYIISHVYA
jgi:hypothetical protein